MWFRKRSDQELEPRPGADAYTGYTNVELPAALRPAPYAVADVPAAKPPGTAPNGQAWHRQIRQLQPPRRRLARGKVINTDAPNQVVSPYNLLRTQIIKRLRENDWSTIAVTSPSRASGNTLTAINLAISIARDPNYTVLLVELNLFAPSFCNILGIKPQPGIVEYLQRDVPIPDIMFNPGIERLVVIPAGTPVSNASELLASTKMSRLLEDLKLRYQPRIILFDLPSVLASDDAMIFAPLVDCALLVVAEGETRVSDVRRSLDYLRSTNILGVVMNKSMHVEADGKIIYR